MKKTFTFLAVTCAAVMAFTSCEMLTGVKMSTAAAPEKVIELYQKHIDTTEYKPITIKWSEEGKLTDKLQMVVITMVGKDLKWYSLPIIVSGPGSGPGEITQEKVTAPNIPADFDQVRFIRPSDVNPAAIVSHFAAAQEYVPDGYRYTSVSNYFCGINPTTGARSDSFEINLTHPGATNKYYSAPFNVASDGTVSPKK